MEKDKVAEILVEIGVLLELKGENPFKARAYTNAARALDNFEGDIAERRPGYVDYVMRTSGFIPLPPHPGRGIEPRPPAGSTPA